MFCFQVDNHDSIFIAYEKGRIVFLWLVAQYVCNDCEFCDNC